jgi:hypothetical protein
LKSATLGNAISTNFFFNGSIVYSFGYDICHKANKK